MDISNVLRCREEALGDLRPDQLILELANVMQLRKDAAYAYSSYKCDPLFQAGDDVVVCSGNYYFAKVGKTGSVKKIVKSLFTDCINCPG